MDEELLKRRQKPIASSKGFILAAQSPVAMEPVTPTKPIENGFVATKSDDIDNDNTPETDGNQVTLSFVVSLGICIREIHPICNVTDVPLSNGP